MWRAGSKRIDDGPEPIIVGSDEAGYGCMAGPLIVGAVAVHRDFYDPDVTDSKDMTQKQREAVVERYTGRYDKVMAYLKVYQPEEIDNLNVYTAQLMGHAAAIRVVLDNLSLAKEWAGDICVVVDGNLPVDDVRTAAKGHSVGHIEALVKADAKVPAVSLASILAKVAQVKVMERIHEFYPEYGFDRHHGYDTPEHREALNRLGPCPVHRRSYKPVRDVEDAMDQAAQPKGLWGMFDEG